MYNQGSQIEEILSQYDVELYEVTKGRGNYICKTNKGSYVLESFRGTKEKGEALYRFLRALKERTLLTEQIKKNKHEEAVTVDEVTGEHFVLKEHIQGEELHPNQFEEVKEVSAKLAEFHNCSNDLLREGILDFQENFYPKENIVDGKQRHLREMTKARNYIRHKKKKNEFERIYMASHASMLKTAEASIGILEKEADVESCLCHGDFHQHNIIRVNESWQIIHFENMKYAWPILDLANFLRKMQEKNNWDIQAGNELLHSYMNVRKLKTVEMEKLYGLLLFPEKFWKVTNHYMNSRKTWITERDIEKLKTVIEQETKRLNFLENLFSIMAE